MLEKDKLQKIRNSEDNWESETVKEALAKFKERQEEFNIKTDFLLDRIYTPLALRQLDYEKDIGFPGEYPFTRGVQPTMYRGKLWTMRQYAGFGTAEESNKRYRYLLEKGQTGLSVAFDLPTQIGYDSDNPIAQGEVGKVGVAIDSLADMEVLFKEIPLDKVSTSMTINASAAILLAMYVVFAEKQGVSTDQLRGTIQNDILKEYAARGTYIFPPSSSMRLIMNIFEYCTRNIPKWNFISVSGYHIREAGSTAVQELAFTIANGIAYVNAAIEAGMDVDEFAGRISFFFNAHNDLLEEVAKFRAARKIWAKIMRENFGAKNPRSWKLRFHTQTAGSTLTAQQPDNNIVRVAIQALAAVFGGTQSLHTNSRDEALALPSEEAVRLALRTQQIVAYESGISEIVDPLAGSYYVERLTLETEVRVMEYLKKIDAMGGAVRAIEQGYIQKEIADSAYIYQKEIEAGKRVVVGLNKFQEEETSVEGLLRVDPAVGEAQIKKLQKLKEIRDNVAVQNKLAELRKAAQGDENLMPYILEAVRLYATEGEICDVLREVFGEYRPVEIL